MKWVPGLENYYAVTTDGQIFSYRKGTPVEIHPSKIYDKAKTKVVALFIVLSHPTYPKRSIQRKGYVEVKHTRSSQFHRLIYETFSGSIPKGYVIHHIDFNVFNNNINNLQCVTRKQHSKYHKEYEAQWGIGTFKNLPATFVPPIPLIS